MRNTNLQYTILQEIDLANSSNHLKRDLLKKYDGTQTKKKGGGLLKFTKKPTKKTWYNPMGISVSSGLRKSTKIAVNPMRYLAFEQTKKKRELRAQQRDASKVDHKLYAYQTLKVTLPEYDVVTSNLKIAKSQGNTKKIAELKAKKKVLAENIRKLGNLSIGTKIDTNKLRTQIDDGLAKYEAKQKYQTDSGQKLKDDAVEYIQNRSEFIKHGQPELKNKLSALTSFDPLKMAVIHVPGQPPKPVNKLKYSDFKVDDPKITNAYLTQFKGVNDSIRKINKDFDIDILSPQRRVELAHELHKITAEGIYDPVAQEKHFLKAVTEIAYKDRYYSTLDIRSKGASFEYLKTEGSIKIEPDKADLNLTQQKSALAQRLSLATSNEEKNAITARINQIESQLDKRPEDIANEIKSREDLLNGAIKPTDRERIVNELIGLRATQQDILQTKKENETLLTQRLNTEIESVNKQIGEQFTAKERKALGTLDQLKATIGNIPDENIQEYRKLVDDLKDKDAKDLNTNAKKDLAVAEDILKKHEYMQYLLQIENLKARDPTNMDKEINALATSNLNTLKDKNEVVNAALTNVNTAIQSLTEHAKTDPSVNQDLAAKQAELAVLTERQRHIKTALTKAEYVDTIKKDTSIPDVMKPYILRNINGSETHEELAGKVQKVKDDETLNLIIARAALMKKKADVQKLRTEAKTNLVTARVEARKTNPIKRRIINSNEMAAAKTKRSAFNAELQKYKTPEEAYEAAIKAGKLSMNQTRTLFKTEGGIVDAEQRAILEQIRKKAITKKVNKYSENNLKRARRFRTTPVSKLISKVQVFEPNVQDKLFEELKEKYKTNPIILAQLERAHADTVSKGLKGMKTPESTNNPEILALKGDRLKRAADYKKDAELYKLIKEAQAEQAALKELPEQPINNTALHKSGESELRVAKIKSLLASKGIAYDNVVKPDGQIVMPDFRYKAPGKTSVEEVNKERKYTPIAVKRVKYELASQEQPVKPVEYASMPNTSHKTYANLGPAGPINSPYATLAHQQKNIPLTSQQAIGFPSANNLVAAKGKLRKVTPDIKEPNTNPNISETLKRKQADILAAERLRERALSALQLPTLFQQAAKKVMQTYPN